MKRARLWVSWFKVILTLPPAFIVAVLFPEAAAWATRRRRGSATAEDRK